MLYGKQQPAFTLSPRVYNHCRVLPVSLVDADAETPGVLHAHPLMWEHFGEQLQREHPEAWRTKVDTSSTEVTITMWRCVHDYPSRNPRIQIA